MSHKNKRSIVLKDVAVVVTALQNEIDQCRRYAKEDLNDPTCTDKSYWVVYAELAKAALAQIEAVYYDKVT